MCSTKELTTRLCCHLLDAGSNGVVPNWFASRQWEMDAAALNRNGYFQEYEIKTTRDDFKADLRTKVRKHMLYKSMHAQKHKLRQDHEFCYVPSQFYYVCQEGLIDAPEVPKYAGLIVLLADNTFKIRRKAPRIHAGKPDTKTITKFYRCMTHRLHNYMKEEIS